MDRNISFITQRLGNEEKRKVKAKIAVTCYLQNIAVENKLHILCIMKNHIWDSSLQVVLILKVSFLTKRGASIIRFGFVSRRCIIG